MTNIFMAYRTGQCHLAGLGFQAQHLALIPWVRNSKYLLSYLHPFLSGQTPASKLWANVCGKPTFLQTFSALLPGAPAQTTNILFVPSKSSANLKSAWASSVPKTLLHEVGAKYDSVGNC